ncbi:VTT domain-containing protein [Xanthomonas campestris pv. asclepiadis]|uniref:DedA family protein n=1 Tax=Xanthomonas campestris TaxID=339 RepID=UPI001E567259|nr:VTT domain-containing protein [Xanthomonas campestris]MCC4617533.1 VTT domain-containing protein [Xanthomonas campestris pv. asclepiadis]
MQTNAQLALVVSCGLPGVLAVSYIEKFIPVVPSYLMLMVVGMTASSAPALLAAWAVSVTGSVLVTVSWYAIGRALGNTRVRAVVGRYGRFVFLRIATYEHLAQSYRRNDFRVTLAGQAIPVARIYLALPAGVIQVRFWAFLLASSLGIAGYNLVFVLVGFFLRGTGHDPLVTGMLIAAALVALECVVFLSIRMKTRAKSVKV